MEHIDKGENAHKTTVETMFLCKAGRLPTTDEMAIALKKLPKENPSKRAAYKNIMWALLNTKEFIFNW